MNELQPVPRFESSWTAPLREGFKKGAGQFVKEVAPQPLKPRQHIGPIRPAVVENAELKRLRNELWALILDEKDKTERKPQEPNLLPKKGLLPSQPRFS